MTVIHFYYFSYWNQSLEWKCNACVSHTWRYWRSWLMVAPEFPPPPPHPRNTPDRCPQHCSVWCSAPWPGQHHTIRRRSQNEPETLTDRFIGLSLSSYTDIQLIKSQMSQSVMYSSAVQVKIQGWGCGFKGQFWWRLASMAGSHFLIMPHLLQ